MADEEPPRSLARPSQTPEEQSVAKANEAIAIRPKRGRLTLLSRRIYNALLYHSQRQGVDEPVYRLALSELIGDAWPFPRVGVLTSLPEGKVLQAGEEVGTEFIDQLVYNTEHILVGAYDDEGMVVWSRLAQTV